MKIKNTTKWDTQDLRSLILAGMKQFLEKDDWKYREMLVIIRKRSKSEVHGRAILGGARIKLYLSDEFEPIQLAWLIGHELNHIIGLDHAEMKGSFFAYWKTSEELISSDLMQWALPYLNIKRKEVKVKEKKDLQIVRYEKAQRVLEEKLKKFKRLQVQIKKWTTKVKYYEKVLVAAGKIDNSKEEKQC